MERVLRWFTRGVHHLYGGSRMQGDPRPTFEHIDSTRLGASGFHASASLGLHDDFAETMPAYVLPQARRAAAPNGRFA